MTCYKITGAAALAASLLLLQLGSTASQSAESGMADVSSFGSIANDIPMLEVDPATVPAQLKHLGTFSDNPDGPETGCTRLIFTEKDIQARNYIKGLMKDAGLEIREDAMGNIFGRWVGSRPDLPAVGTGSHADAIPKSGIYDGVLGVVGPIEALAALRRAGFKPKRSLEVLMFTSEEPTRFGISCVGSRAMAGYLDPKRLDGLKDILDETGGFRKAAQSAGYGKGMTTEEIVKDARLPDDYYSAFVELHIEQGPELEEKRLDIGIVTGIAAPAALKIDFEGDGGHAGAQLMPWRNDALLAAAELALKVERLALDTGAIDTVATTGVMEVGPGAINSVPRTAHMEVDIRDVDGERRDGIVDAVIEHATKFAAPRRVRVKHEIINRDPPAKADDAINVAVGLAVSRLKLTHQRMVSRAYHDSLFMAAVWPTSMVFIPCYKGYSHRPDEYSSPEDIKNGVQTLALAMATLSMA